MDGRGPSEVPFSAPDQMNLSSQDLGHAGAVNAHHAPLCRLFSLFRTGTSGIADMPYRKGGKDSATTGGTGFKARHGYGTYAFVPLP